MKIKIKVGTSYLIFFKPKKKLKLKPRPQNQKRNKRILRQKPRQESIVWDCPSQLFLINKEMILFVCIISNLNSNVTNHLFNRPEVWHINAKFHTMTLKLGT